MSDWNMKVIEEFRRGGGKVATFDGATLLLLHTIGARTGAARVNPLIYLDVGGGAVAVFASKAGASTNPDWYYNLLAHPRVVAEIGTERRHFRARDTQGAERQRILNEQKRIQPIFAEYEAKTDRQIPVVLLEPVADDKAAP